MNIYKSFFGKKSAFDIKTSWTNFKEMINAVNVRLIAFAGKQNAYQSYFTDVWR